MMRKFLLAVALWTISVGAYAQNTQCSDRPPGDSSNACANTRFVGSAIGTNASAANHAVAIGKGVGVPGFNSAGPSIIGTILTSLGASVDPVFQAAAGGISPEAFGATGNGILYNTNATISSGTGALTVAAGTFTSGDIGKKIVVPGAGAASGTLAATITGVSSSTSITISPNASTSLVAASTDITYGTDDTTSIQAWATALATYGGQGNFPQSKNYIITSEILFQPQSSDAGGAISGNFPSDIWFKLNNKTVNVNFNNSRLTAAASMTNMVRFIYNSGLPGTYGEFFCKIERAALNGASLATNGIYMNAEGQCNVERNRVYGVTSAAIKATSYGVNIYSYNVLRAPTTFDLTDGGADSLYIHNDLYPTQRGFYMTAATGGQLRIFSNAGTNELAVSSPGTTVYFIQIDSSANSNVIRDVSVINNGVSGFTRFLYARGNSGQSNNRDFVIQGNNALDYGSKTDIGFSDTTETANWTVTGNHFHTSAVTSTLEVFLATNDSRSTWAQNQVTPFSTGQIAAAAYHFAFVNGSVISSNTGFNIGNTTTATKVMRLTNASANNNVNSNILIQGSAGTFAPNGIVEEDTSNSNIGGGNISQNITTCMTLVGANSSMYCGGVASLAAGGTNNNITPVSGGIVWSDATKLNVSSAMAANAIILGGGAGVSPFASGCTITTTANSLNCSSVTSFRPAFFLENTTNDAGNAGFSFQKSRSGGNITSGDILGSFGINGFVNGAYQPLGGMQWASTGTFSGSNAPSVFKLFTSNASGHNNQTLQFDQGAHFSTIQATAPTITAGCNGAGSSIGTGSSDFAGWITGQTAAATTCTITFGTAFTNRPSCVVTGEQSAILTMAPSTTTLAVTFASTANYRFNWICSGA